MNRPVIERSLCTDCALCVDMCSLNVFQLQGDDVVVVQHGECDECGECVEICPTEALIIIMQGE
ncbi:MAG: 4Fe-4S binding protein [Dehalococcoidia bacterium]|nr:4Fe-4S binding protein [Dehalococcoidia bacterium]